MTITAENFEILNAVNRCQIAELKKAGSEFKADSVEHCTAFYNHVRNVQSAVIHTYQLIAYASIREADPKKAALLWKSMGDFCDSALNVLRDLKEKYQNCGTSQLYDLALDYKGQAQKRYYQNLQDSECQPMPVELFPQMT
jgi:hypothetical protein